MEWLSYWDLSPYVHFWLYPHEFALVYKHAQITVQQWVNDKKNKKDKNGVSGKSRIYGRKRKKKDVERDAIVGGFGNLVGNMMWFGRDWGLWMFDQSRRWHNANPREGDQGSDIPGFQIDWKGGRYYATKKEDITKKPCGLLNRDGEWGRGKYIAPGVLSKYFPHAPYWHKQYYFNFFLQTVDNIKENIDSPYNHIRDDLVKVYITGWIKGEDITEPFPMDSSFGIYRDAYCVPITDLHPLEKFPYGKHLWWWKNGMKREVTL
jgi:hypothetical protein